ncbi:MAG: TRAP transporter small permease [Salinarimonas sp.]|nr:TRAP transporter small permease [Salinarimonas sp.]
MSERRAQSWPVRVFGLLSRANYAIALICGVVLLATVIFILVDIAMRQIVGRGLGGSDEISGYVIAGVAAWGFSYALVERAHVRIDVLTGRLPPAGRAVFDLAAAATLMVVAALVTSYGWRVFARSWNSNSRANTPLETPLWIPQSIWLAGWGWLTLVALVVTICLAALMLMRRFESIHAIGGVGSEMENEQ